MKKLFSLLILLASLQAPASTSQLSGPSYLRKLSLQIRGVGPTPAEYNELQGLQKPEEVRLFFDRKIDEYLHSTQAQDRMVFRLSEKFQVKTPEMDITQTKQLSDVQQTTYFGSSQSERSGIYLQDALTDIFARMSRENLPWDALLTTKEYNLFPKLGDDPEVMTDFSFFRTVKPDLPRDYNDSDEGFHGLSAPTPLRFDPNDESVAGVLTTPRFLSRYNGTNVNKNRRRAAAVFRIFLCDPMFPIIPPAPDKKAANLADAFDDAVHGQFTEQQLSESMTITDAQRHGADPKCAACHDKLDPMGRTFQNIGIALNSEPAGGHLVYTRGNGEKVNLRLNGIGDLGKAVTQQPEYLSCQIDWFWKQFIGADAVLTPDRKMQLAQQFEAVGRRTNDFIKLLVTLPEFQTRPLLEEQISFARVQPLLKHCDTCHDDEGYIPSFADGDIEKSMLLTMRHKLNLPENDKDRMPKDWRKWDPKDLDAVKKWLDQGAHSTNGKAQLSADDLKGAK